MMFYQNSNDLVKNASMKSGHVQNSKETRALMMNHTADAAAADAAAADGNRGSDVNNRDSSEQPRASASLSVGAQFQNMIQSMIQGFSLKEGIGSAGGGASVPATQSTGIGGNGNVDQGKFINSQVAEDKKYTQQELEHIKKVGGIMNLIEKDEKNRRQNWVEVTDAAGITKYGYITKDGIFQIWHVPSSPSANPTNWLQTDNMKQNTGVIGCPAPSSTIQKIRIAGSWDDIKPYDLVYADSDSGRTNPLFMVINDVVRDPKNSFGKKGLFSCGNERGNVYVSERPSADFQFPGSGVDTIQMGCYVVANNATDSDFTNRGFTFQHDLSEASISQCKRRAEDLGSTYFLVSAPEKDKPNNRGGCWIYTNSGKPNISGILSLNENGGKCHTMTNPESDEDGFLKSYTNTNLKRFYGKDINNENNYERSVALYSLKKGGPTGVDEIDRNGTGYIGRIAYVDHNGERHDYPASALTFMAPSKNEKGETKPASYLNLGGYDTRSALSSYSLKEIKPGSYSEASNLLYKASRDGWGPQRFHELCDNKGATYTRAILNDGRVLGAYTSLSWSSTVQWYQHDTTAFLYDGTTKYPATNSIWGSGMYATYMNSSHGPTFGGGHDMYIWGQNMYNNAYTFTTSDGKAPFGRNRYTYQQYTLRDLEVYSVDANTFPNTFPKTLDFERRLRTMPVGESITASFEKCRGMCDADEKCGGFVYTKGSGGADGKCELKDKSKMYPVGLRVADPTKQLMLKVPTINSSISDDKCKVANGAYKTIDSAQYAHYPDTGSMSSGVKCNMRNIVPKQGSLQASDLTSIFGAVDKAFEETVSKTDEYREQTTSKDSAVPVQTTGTESFTVLREGLSYMDTMSDVSNNLNNISKSQYQRERLLAMNDESNKLLISESYKFILWSILAILTVLAVLKLKDMFGQDDVDESDGGGETEGGGFLATILGWFGVKSAKTDDIADRTGEVKAALTSAGEQLKETGENLATGLTEGADNLVTSMNDAAVGAVEGAKGLADKVSETASAAVDQIGSSTGIGAATATVPATGPATRPATGFGFGSGTGTTTGGTTRGKHHRTGKK